MTGANCAVLAGVWALEQWVAERHWLTMLLVSLPQWPFLVPTGFLLAAALILRQGRLVAVNLFISVFGLVALLGLRLGLPEYVRGPTLRVMTFNIEGGAKGIPAVLDTVRQTQPDVICFQEAGPYARVNSVPFITPPMLPRYHVISHGELVFASRLPIVAHTLVPLPPGPESRAGLQAVVLVGGRRVTIMTLHLLPNQFDQHLTGQVRELADYLARNARERAAQDALLLAAVRRVRTPLLVCGDFNTPACGLLYRRLTRYAPDAFEQAGCGFGYTIPSSAPMLRLDHILIRNGLSVGRAFVPAVHASDHRPLVADVAFASPP